MAGELTRKGKGRPKGSPNRVSRELKEMVLEALDRAGGVEYLVRQAKKKNAGPFLALVAKVLPLTINGNIDTRHWVMRLPQPAETNEEWLQQHHQRTLESPGNPSQDRKPN